MTQLSDQPFVHLHVHTEYSLLDGLSKIGKLVKHAKSLNMPALAITDHGTMFGVMEFYRACKDAGIKPIIGMEGYLARRSMRDRDGKEDQKSFHMLMLARSQDGYQSLLKIASAAQLEGYYYRPRVDLEYLRQHARDLVVTSGCIAGQIPQLILDGREQAARDLIDDYRQIFGRENFFIELQDHDIEELRTINNWLIETALRDDIPMLATNDVHYVLENDYDAHDTLLCIQNSASKTDEKRMRMSGGNSYFLAEADRMWRSFGHLRGGEALTNTLLVAEMCDVDLSKKEYHLPVFPVPEGYTATTYMRALCEKGLRWRYGANADDAVYRERLDYELGTIDRMGFNTYFLIVWDLCQYARSADIWYNVRGSGAGCMVAYCLGITSIDPIENNLLFERFLNPGRSTMPDIDMDFPDDERLKMIDYSVRKYGEDKVAAIITFGTMAAKGALRDVGRALGIDLAIVNQASNMIPTEPKPKPIKQYVEDNPELKRLIEGNPEMAHAVDVAAELQGLARHPSTHAAGVIIADRALVEYLPLHRQTSSSENVPIRQVTQFEMETCESIGLLKVDFLGLSTLSYMRRACELIEKHHRIHYSMENVPIRPTGDPETDRKLANGFRLMTRGDTIGIFQLESPGMQKMLREMKPTMFEHIIAAVSLYRPGPMDFIPMYNRRMHGEEPIRYHHPKLEPILAETFGILVYQEQIMQVASSLFGYSLGDADLMRRAVSKKKKEELEKHRAIFIAKGPENGVNAETSAAIFKEVDFFANYGFNRCVVGSTEIIDADSGRVVTIADLASGNVAITHTLTLNPVTQKLERGEVAQVWENGVKPVFRLTTGLGRQIEATANHPFLTFDGWRTLDTLKPGDLVATLHPEPVFAGDSSAQFRQVGRYPDAVGVPLYAQTGMARRELSPTASVYSDIYWDAIVSIEPTGEQNTYDLTIPGTHNFVANNIIVHNSHAADYAALSVQTAFLKAEYPHEYMAALLSVYREKPDKITLCLTECKRLDIPLMLPDVNASQLDFDIQTLADGKRAIRFGLAAVKNAGVAALTYLLQCRETDGPFRDLDDLCVRVDLRILGKRALESLIKVGALQAFGTRPALHGALDRIIAHSIDLHKAKEIGQMGMFGESTSSELLENLPKVEEATSRQQLDWERELLGFYVSSHPTDALMAYNNIENTGLQLINVLREAQTENPAMSGQMVKLVGLVVGLRKMVTKSKDMMCIATLEDRTATIDAVMFPRTYARYVDMVEEGKVFFVTGKLDFGRGEPQIVIEQLTDKLETTGAADAMRRDDSARPAWMDDAPDVRPTPIAVSNGHAAPMEARALVQAGEPPAYLETETAEYVTNSVEPPSFDELPPLFDNEDTPVPPRHLVLCFERRSDNDMDTRRLERLLNVLHEHHGRDTFEVIVMEGEIETHRLTWKDRTTRISDELRGKIGRMKGISISEEVAAVP